MADQNQLDSYDDDLDKIAKIVLDQQEKKKQLLEAKQSGGPGQFLTDLLGGLGSTLQGGSGSEGARAVQQTRAGNLANQLKALEATNPSSQLLKLSELKRKTKEGEEKRAQKQRGAEQRVKAKQGGAGGAKMLQSSQVLKVNEGKAIPRLLTDIDQTIAANADMFGPIGGRLAALNPYDERAKTIDAQVRSASQAFGRYMEQGVLRKEDEDKYRKMFPNISDTPEVAKSKLQIVDRLLKNKLVSDIESLKKSGYDVGGLEEQINIPKVPKVLGGKNVPRGTSAIPGLPAQNDIDSELRRRGVIK